MVEKALNDNKKCRDSDMFLASYIWWKEVEDVKSLDAGGMLVLIASGRVTNYESISRARRILQQLHPDLRGKKYEKRHKKQEEVIDDIQLIKAERTGLGY